MNLPDCYSLINAQTYQDILEKILHHTIKNPANYHDDFTNAKMLELVYHLKKDAAHNQSVYNSNSQAPLRLKNTLVYMKEHFRENLTLALLGKYAGYTPSYFEKLFVQTMKTTPQKYIENLRIEHAKYLLIQDELSIADISYECGFASQTYFAAVFKKHTFITPFEFRKNAISFGTAAYQQSSPTTNKTN